MRGPNAPPRSLTAHDVAICGLIALYVEGIDGQAVASPYLERLLAYTARLIFSVDAPTSTLERFLLHLTLALDAGDGKRQDEKLQQQGAAYVTQLTDFAEEMTKKAARRGRMQVLFTQYAQLLMRDDLVMDDQSKSLKAPERQLDEASPMGSFLQTCTRAFLSLSDDDIEPLRERIEWWCVSGDAGTLLPTEEFRYLDKDAHYARAIHRGDYSAARAMLEGSITQPPADSAGESLADMLYRNADFHLQMKAYEKARESLEECLRLARAANETDIIASCDALDRRIKLEKARANRKAPQSLSEAKRKKHITPSNVEELYFTVEEGASRIQAINVAHRFATQPQTAMSNRSSDASSSRRDALFLEAQQWYSLGSDSNALITLQALRESLVDVRSDEELQFKDAVEGLYAEMLAQAGDVEQAISLLMDAESLKRISVHVGLPAWHLQVMTMLYKAAKRSGLKETADKIARIVPDVCKGMESEVSLVRELRPLRHPQRNEATFARESGPTHDEFLEGRLAFAAFLRGSRNTTSGALVTAAEVRELAEACDNVVLVRAASVEAAQCLAQMDLLPQAADALDEVMPGIQASSNAEMRATAACTYAKISLKPSPDAADGEHAKEDGATLQVRLERAICWLDQSLDICKAADLAALHRDVQYFRARVLDGLDRTEERDEAAQQCLDLEKKLQDRAVTIAGVVDDVQEIVALAGGRAVVGR